MLHLYVRSSVQLFLIVMLVVTADILFLFAENEVDRKAFLLLTESQVHLMVKAIGAQNKLISRVKY